VKGSNYFGLRVADFINWCQAVVVVVVHHLN
jgi:hypothetical protein